MKIYEGKDEKGKLVFFEVPNSFLFRSGAIKVINNIPGVQVRGRQNRFAVIRHHLTQTLGCIRPDA